MRKYEPLWVINGFSVTASPDVIAELAKRPEVESITSDDRRHRRLDRSHANPATASATDSAVINAPALSGAIGFYGQGVVVANLDSGVDVSHPDLRAATEAARTRGSTRTASTRRHRPT